MWCESVGLSRADWRKVLCGTAPAVVLVAGLLLIPSDHAAGQSQIWRCINPGGVPVFQNAPGKDCERLDLAPINVIPAQQGQSASPARVISSPPTAKAPGSYPSVSNTAQKRRDDERRAILQGELQREQGRLEVLRTEYNRGEPERRGDERNFQKYLDRVERLKNDVSRAETNIASLQRELEAVGK